MEFKQLASGEPPDIEATMTSSEAEIFRSGLKDCGAEESASYDFVNQACEGGGAQVTFIIPGDSAADDSDLLTELEDYLEHLNNKAL